MKVLVFGSSQARDLYLFDDETIHYIRAIRFKFFYKFHSGKSFEYILSNPHLIDEALNCRPDFVIVIFGANSVSTEVEKKNVLDACRDFYQLLYTKLNQQNVNAKLIASECPMRYVYNLNHNTPPPPEFFKFRRSLIKKIDCLREKHYKLRLSGKARLESEVCYRDGVHFTPEGLQTFFSNIIGCLQYILDKESWSYHTERSYPFEY